MATDLRTVDFEDIRQEDGKMFESLENQVGVNEGGGEVGGRNVAQSAEQGERKAEDNNEQGEIYSRRYRYRDVS